MSLPTPTLHTARLRLRPFTSADGDALFALHTNARVLRYWDAPPWSERARAERFIAACQQMAKEGSGARLAIERVSDGAFIGWCSLTGWNPDYRSASMGYCLDDAAWGHGYATEAGRSLLQWGFDTLDLNRVQAETDTRNLASARVLEKLGFLREGTLREDCVVNGEVSDSWVYGLLRRHWQHPSPGPDPAAPALQVAKVLRATTSRSLPATGGLHHLELWVPDLDRAAHSWGWLLQALGYEPFQHWADGRSWRLSDHYVVLEQSAALSAEEHDRLRPGLNHVALHAGNRAGLDSLVAAAVAHGWALLFADRHPRAGGADHYAAYLEDADGFEVELVADVSE